MSYKCTITNCILAVPLAAGFGVASAGEVSGDRHHHEHSARAMATSDDPHAHHRAMLSKPAEPPKSTRVDLLDLSLVDQDGKPVKFVSDVIGERIVVMDFIYTTCTTICPVITAVFEQVQKRLGDELGKDVLLVSISIDPARDTPQRLKAYSVKHRARPGWVWLTGQKRTVDSVLDGLGAYTTDFENHANMVLVGDGRSGRWTRFFGFPSPDRLVEQVDTLRATRGAVAGDRS